MARFFVLIFLAINIGIVAFAEDKTDVVLEAQKWCEHCQDYHYPETSGCWPFNGSL